MARFFLFVFFFFFSKDADDLGFYHLSHQEKHWGRVANAELLSPERAFLSEAGPDKSLG